MVRRNNVSFKSVLVLEAPLWVETELILKTTWSMILKRKRRIPIYFRMGFGISKQVTISERHKEKYRWVIQLRLSYGKTLLSWLINLFASKSPGFFKRNMLVLIFSFWKNQASKPCHTLCDFSLRIPINHPTCMNHISCCCGTIFVQPFPYRLTISQTIFFSWGL